MSVIGIYDSDLMEHGPTIPNLECMKLLSWHKKKHDIAVLVHKLDPAPYTKFYIRKDYNDYNYPSIYGNSNVEFGGFAFSSNYIPMGLDIEHSVPDIEAYRKFSDKIISSRFGDDNGPANGKRDNLSLLRSQHARLSLDGMTLDPLWERQLRAEDNMRRNLILHDFNVGNIRGAPDELLKIVKKYPYSIGVKFPIILPENDYISLKKWNEIPTRKGFFELHYYGIIEDDFFEKYSMSKSFIYHISSVSENDLIQDILPKILKQSLYLRSINKKITLKYDGSELWTKFIELINVLGNIANKTYALYDLLRSIKSLDRYKKENGLLPLTKNLPLYRTAFNIIREKNYELFTDFYQLYKVHFEEGRIING